MATQVIFGFHNTHLVDVLGKGHQKNDKRTAEVIINGGKNPTAQGAALAVGEILRLDTSPVGPDGKPYPGNDPTVNGPTFHKHDDDNNGKSPIIEWSWGSGDREFSNSGNDPYGMGSYEDNGGCTPTLKLTEPIGPGVNACWAYAYVRPEYNGGVSVKGDVVTWNAD